MASGHFLLALAIIVVAAIVDCRAATQVNFNDDRTLPQTQKARDVTNDVTMPHIRALQNLLSALERREAKRTGSECDDACMERRAEKLFPIARRFLSSVSDKVARSLGERDEGVKRAVRGISEALYEAKKKRAMDMFEGQKDERGFLEELEDNMEERGVIQKGLHADRNRPQTREAQEGLRAAEGIATAIKKRALAAREADDKMMVVRGLAENLEERSESRTKEALRRGARAIQDLTEAMQLEKRAEKVRSFMEKEQNKRALDLSEAITKRTLDIQKTEDLKRGLKDVSNELKKRAFERETEEKRALDEVKQLATRALGEKVSMLAKRVFNDEEKRELAGMNIMEGISKAKRELELRTVDQKREVALSKISEGVEQAKRDFERRELDKKRELAGMKIAESIAKAKRAFDKRNEEEKKEVAEAAVKMASVKRALEDLRQTEQGKRALETLEKYRRALDLGEEKHLQAVRALEGLKMSLEKRELGLRALKEEQGVRAVRDIGDSVMSAMAKRALDLSRRENELKKLEAMLEKKAEA